MTARAANRPHPWDFDVETYATELAAEAPPLTAEQLDALRQVTRPAPDKDHTKGLVVARQANHQRFENPG